MATVVWDNYTLTPQEFANATALGALNGGRSAALKAEHDAAAAKVPSEHEQNRINAGSSTRAIQDLADAVNLERSLASLLHGASVAEDAAKAFRDGGEFGVFRSYLGPIVNALYDAGVVDEGEVRAALNA